jgi:hypothetical protein
MIEPDLPEAFMLKQFFIALPPKFSNFELHVDLWHENEFLILSFQKRYQTELNFNLQLTAMVFPTFSKCSITISFVQMTRVVITKLHLHANQIINNALQTAFNRLMNGIL